MEQVKRDVLDDAVSVTLKSWLANTFERCSCDPALLPAKRCNRHIEFLWRKRYKDDLVSQFMRSEPWISRVDRLRMRELMVSSLNDNGYSCLLANTTSAKARVRFPNGEIHRVTGIAFGIRRRRGGAPVMAMPKPIIKPALKPDESFSSSTATWLISDADDEEVDGEVVIDETTGLCALASRTSNVESTLDEEDLLTAFNATMDETQNEASESDFMPMTLRSQSSNAGERKSTRKSGGRRKRSKAPPAEDMFSSLLLPEEMKPFDDFGDEDGDDLMPLPSISALYKFCDDDTVYGCLMGDETNPEDDGPLIAYRVPDEELPFCAPLPPRPEPLPLPPKPIVIQHPPPKSRPPVKRPRPQKALSTTAVLSIAQAAANAAEAMVRDKTVKSGAPPTSLPVPPKLIAPPSAAHQAAAAAAARAIFAPHPFKAASHAPPTTAKRAPSAAVPVAKVAAAKVEATKLFAAVPPPCVGFDKSRTPTPNTDSDAAETVLFAEDDDQSSGAKPVVRLTRKRAAKTQATSDIKKRHKSI